MKISTSILIVMLVLSQTMAQLTLTDSPNSDWSIYVEDSGEGDGSVDVSVTVYIESFSSDVSRSMAWYPNDDDNSLTQDQGYDGFFVYTFDSGSDDDLTDFTSLMFSSTVTLEDGDYILRIAVSSTPMNYDAFEAPGVGTLRATIAAADATERAIDESNWDKDFICFLTRDQTFRDSAWSGMTNNLTDIPEVEVLFNPFGVDDTGGSGTEIGGMRSGATQAFSLSAFAFSAYMMI